MLLTSNPHDDPAEELPPSADGIHGDSERLVSLPKATQLLNGQFGGLNGTPVKEPDFKTCAFNYAMCNAEESRVRSYFRSK